jgi:hypothetical protein
MHDETKLINNKHLHNSPIPGGPLSNAAFHGPFGPLILFTVLFELLNVCSQLLSQTFSFLTLSEFPRISELVEGAYLSAQRALSPN